MKEKNTAKIAKEPKCDSFRQIEFLSTKYELKNSERLE